MIRFTLAVLMAGLLLGPGITQDAPKGDHDKIRGTWKVISLETRENPGKKVPDEKIKEGRLIITKDKLVMSFQGKEATGYKINKLDPTKKPKEIDLTLLGKDKAGNTYEKPAGAIYQLNGDDLTLCIGDPSPEPKRPTEFEVSKRGILLFVLKRDKN